MPHSTVDCVAFEEFRYAKANQQIGRNGDHGHHFVRKAQRLQTLHRQHRNHGSQEGCHLPHRTPRTAVQVGKNASHTAQTGRQKAGRLIFREQKIADDTVADSHDRARRDVRLEIGHSLLALPTPLKLARLPRSPGLFFLLNRRSTK